MLEMTNQGVCNVRQVLYYYSGFIVETNTLIYLFNLAVQGLVANQIDGNQEIQLLRRQFSKA